MTTAKNQSLGVRKKQKYTTQKKQNTKPKLQWVYHPMNNILFDFIRETFTSKAKKSSQLPVNDFIKYYNQNLDKIWLKLIVGNLAPFITSLSSISKYDIDNTKASISFFASNLYEVTIQIDYQQTKIYLITTVGD